MAWVVDGIVLILPVALWAAVVTPGHRRVGDLAAGTFVVRRRAMGEPVRFASRPWQAQVPSAD